MSTLEQAADRTTVVIPSIRGRTLLERLLPSIDLRLDQVVVVEQGSEDGSEKFCRAAGAQVLQMGRQATFTEACNAGIRFAMERQSSYILLANNDLQFITPVAHQLLTTCLENGSVGAAAPTQVMLAGLRPEWLAYRAAWDLSKPSFGHDIEGSLGWPRDVDADFCEFTCVMVPAAVFRDVGLLDDEYGFYHEDADFGYRLWTKGYRALYNQQARVFHWGSSTVKTTLGDRNRQTRIRHNLKRFRSKHLAVGVDFLQAQEMGCAAHSWDVIVDHFTRTFAPLGLLRSDGPTFALGHPGQLPSRYLYTVWETTALPDSWMAPLRRYEQIFVSSEWTRQVFQAAGFTNTHTLPLGVDPNVFCPHPHRYEFGAEKVFLVNARPQRRKALEVTLAAWHRARALMPGATLAFFCPGDLLGDEWVGEQPVVSVDGKFYRRWYPGQGVLVLQPLNPLTYAEMADLYRGSHCLVTNSRSEGFGLQVVEAMACGTLCIVPNYGATAEFVEPDVCLPIGGTPVPADYADKGFTGVGAWWEPSADDLTAQLLRAYAMPDAERLEFARKARRMVTARYTWRQVARILHSHLSRLQGAADGAPAGSPRKRFSWQPLCRACHRLQRDRLGLALTHAGTALQTAGQVVRRNGGLGLLRRGAGSLRRRLLACLGLLRRD